MSDLESSESSNSIEGMSGEEVQWTVIRRRLSVSRDELSAVIEKKILSSWGLRR